MFPLKAVLDYSRCRMNQRLAEYRIRNTCRELLAGDTRVSGRGLRRELRKRFGAVGQTERVFRIWREEAAPKAATPPIPADVAQLQERLDAALAAAQANRERAERAEYREQAHQDHWALEVDRLREKLRAQPNFAGQIRSLQEQVLRLTAELSATRALLGQR